MRGITITYHDDEPEEVWKTLTNAFLAAIDADEALAGKFTYQIAFADDGIGFTGVAGTVRRHWPRCRHRTYFKAFAIGLRDLADEPPNTLGAYVAGKTAGW